VWLVLCSGDDPAGLWSYLGLGRRGLAPLELVTPEALGWALGISHSIRRTGVFTEIELADGRRLVSTEIRGVLNRLTGIPPAVLGSLRLSDRDYAVQELHALHLSWLAALPVPVVNPPTPFAMAGLRLGTWEWMARAAGAGLPVADRPPIPTGPPQPSTPGERSLLAVGEQVLAPVGSRAAPPPRIVRGVRRLARSTGLPVLEARFATAGGEPWAFRIADPLPDLRRWGEPALCALHAVLRNGGTP
jgi:hypothetical protein